MFSPSPHLTLGVGWVEGLAAGPGGQEVPGPGAVEAGTLNLALGDWGPRGSKPPALGTLKPCSGLASTCAQIVFLLLW